MSGPQLNPVVSASEARAITEMKNAAMKVAAFFFKSLTPGALESVQVHVTKGLQLTTGSDVSFAL
jgi:hypothetical protein